jgi:hypothetical protein
VVAIGTEAWYGSIVNQGATAVIPQYAFQNGQILVDHYNVLTAQAGIYGWIPHAITTISPLAIPLFGAVFSISHSLDSIHSYLNNHCSLTGAITNVTKGGLVGTGLGVAYYGLVATFGISYIPLISSTLCLSWLVYSYLRKGSSSSDLVMGFTGNISSILTYVLVGNPLLALAASLAGSVVGHKVHSLITSQWTSILRRNLVTRSKLVLGIPDDTFPTKSEIESVYRRLARQCHPDKAGGDRTQFEIITVAKDILLFDFEENEKFHEPHGFISTVMDALRHVAMSFTQAPGKDHFTQEPILPSKNFLDLPD